MIGTVLEIGKLGRKWETGEHEWPTLLISFENKHVQSVSAVHCGIICRPERKL